MGPISLRKRDGYLTVGGIGLAVAAGYLAMSFRLPFGRLDSPGAGVFPILVGLLTISASLITLWEGWRMDRADGVDLPAGTDLKRVLALVGLLFGYLVALPWLGQLPTSLVFCALLMRLLSTLGWLRIGSYSAAMCGAVYAVFVALLKVPLPPGALFE